MQGYLYCFTNVSMPGIVKVGMTGALERTPELRAKELSSSSGVPTPFKVEFAKLVSEPKKKETTLHRLLEQYTKRINNRREFFKVSPEIVKTFFDLIDGDLWVNSQEDEGEYEKIEEEEEEEEEEDKDHTKNVIKKLHRWSRDMSKCFTDGQLIRHTIGVDKTWIGTYDYANNRVICDAKFYTSLSGFVNAHHKENGTYTCKGVNGWRYSECKVNGEWISTFNL